MVVLLKLTFQSNTKSSMPGSQNELNLQLIQAANEGDLNKVIELISKGADVNAKDKDERTPLHLAAQYGHTEIVELLLKKESIDVNAKNKYGQTPLHHAAWEDHTAIVELLLKKKSIDVNAKDEYDQTPLHSAAWEGHTVKENLSNVYQFHEILHCKKSLQDVRYLY